MPVSLAQRAAWFACRSGRNENASQNKNDEHQALACARDRLPPCLAPVPGVLNKTALTASEASAVLAPTVVRLGIAAGLFGYLGVDELGECINAGLAVGAEQLGIIQLRTIQIERRGSLLVTGFGEGCQVSVDRTVYFFTGVVALKLG